MEKILLVSNSDERTGLQLALERMGFEISRPGENPDAIIATAVDTDGARLSNVVRLSETSGKVPLLLAVDAASLGQNDRILEMADDFIFAPFNASELAFRMKALLKKSKVPDEGPQTLSCGDLVADRASLSIHVAGQIRSLSVLEFKLLWFLMLCAGKVVSRPNILQNVWKGTVVSNRTIDAHIVGLRRALQGMQFRIETIYGAGYSLRGPDEMDRTNAA
ncbi:MAG: response regulator transcription factor [Deltaproteobacteria bacterium]|nr:response regulator transcription factor [Deltaproteobacteria bacterium]